MLSYSRAAPRRPKTSSSTRCKRRLATFLNSRCQTTSLEPRQERAERRAGERVLRCGAQRGSARRAEEPTAPRRPRQGSEAHKGRGFCVPGLKVLHGEGQEKASGTKGRAADQRVLGRGGEPTSGSLRSGIGVLGEGVGWNQASAPKPGELAAQSFPGWRDPSSAASNSFATSVASPALEFSP